jgi:hypothetical protein
MILANPEKANRNTFTREYDPIAYGKEIVRSVEVNWWRPSARRSSGRR